MLLIQVDLDVAVAVVGRAVGRRLLEVDRLEIALVPLTHRLLDRLRGRVLIHPPAVRAGGDRHGRAVVLREGAVPAVRVVFLRQIRNKGSELHLIKVVARVRAAGSRAVSCRAFAALLISCRATLRRIRHDPRLDRIAVEHFRLVPEVELQPRRREIVEECHRHVQVRIVRRHRRRLIALREAEVDFAPVLDEGLHDRLRHLLGDGQRAVRLRHDHVPVVPELVIRVRRRDRVLRVEDRQRLDRLQDLLLAEHRHAVQFIFRLFEKRYRPRKPVFPVREFVDQFSPRRRELHVLCCEDCLCPVFTY